MGVFHSTCSFAAAHGVSHRLTVKPPWEIQEAPTPPREALATTILAPPFVALMGEKGGLLSKAPFTGIFALEIAGMKAEKPILLTYKRLSLIYGRLLLIYIAALQVNKACFVN